MFLWWDWHLEQHVSASHTHTCSDFHKYTSWQQNLLKVRLEHTGLCNFWTTLPSWYYLVGFQNFPVLLEQVSWVITDFGLHSRWSSDLLQSFPSALIHWWVDRSWWKSSKLPWKCAVSGKFKFVSCRNVIYITLSFINFIRCSHNNYWTHWLCLTEGYIAHRWWLERSDYRNWWMSERERPSSVSPLVERQAGYTDKLVEVCKSPLFQESMLLSFWSLLGRAYKWPKKEVGSN